MIYFISHSLWSFTVHQLDFKGLYRNIIMRLGMALVVSDLYGLFLPSGHFQSKRVRRS